MAEVVDNYRSTGDDDLGRNLRIPKHLVGDQQQDHVREEHGQIYQCESAEVQPEVASDAEDQRAVDEEYGDEGNDERDAKNHR